MLRAMPHRPPVASEGHGARSVPGRGGDVGQAFSALRASSRARVPRPALGCRRDHSEFEFPAQGPLVLRFRAESF
jgi:hypothetical protein